MECEGLLSGMALAIQVVSGGVGSKINDYINN
jgi:hypothetical protein